MVYYKAVFKLFQKLHLQIYESHSWHHKFTSICHFESGKCGKEVEKLQKIEYLENETNSLDEIKKHFS